MNVPHLVLHIHTPPPAAGDQFGEVQLTLSSADKRLLRLNVPYFASDRRSFEEVVSMLGFATKMILELWEKEPWQGQPEADEPLEVQG